MVILVILLLLLLLWLILPCGKRKRGDFFGLSKYDYAHRGLHGDGVPENSLAAFRRAVEQGYGAELDVHLTKDGRLAVMHDESLQRTAGVLKNLCDCTAEELKTYRLENTQEKVPFLEEVLPLFEGKTPLVIELKPFRKNHAALSAAVCKMLEDFPQLSFCIESFDPRVLLWLEKNRPDIVRGQLSENFLRDRNALHLPVAFLLTNLFTNCLTRPHFYAYRFQDRKRLSLMICKKLWGVQEFSWTLRSVQQVKQAKREGAIVIFEHCHPQ